MKVYDNSAKSRTKILFLYTVLITTAYTLIIGYFGIYNNYREFNEKANQMEERYIEEQKQLIIREMDRVYGMLLKEKEYLDKNVAFDIKDRVSGVAELMSSYAKAHKHKNKDEILSELTFILKSYKWLDGKGYFYIFDKNKKIVFHGANSSIVGKNIEDLDITSPELLAFIDNSIKYGAVYGSYFWTKPNVEKKLFKKIAYSSPIDGLDIYIAAGIYTDEIESKLKIKILDSLEGVRFGKNGYGYFWVQTLNHKMLMHPVNPELIGKDISRVISKDGVYISNTIYDIATKYGEGFMNYMWIRPGFKTEEEKVSYIKYFIGWDWIIGTGFYTEDIKNMIAREKEDLNERSAVNRQKIIFFLGILYLITFAATLTISNYLRKLDLKQKKYLSYLNQYRQVIDESSIVSITDINGNILYVNDKFTEVSQYREDEVLGRNHGILRNPNTPKEVYISLWKTIKKGLVWNGVIKNRRKDGSSYYVRTTIMPLTDEKGFVNEYISAAQDITELVENKSKLESFFYTDIMTGLGSKLKLLDDIELSEKPLLAVIDIKNFRNINDLYGQVVGDEVIKVFALKLYSGVSVYGYKSYRLHADIFAVLCEKGNFRDFEENIMFFMNKTHKSKITTSKELLSIACCAGLSFENKEKLLPYANIALLYAKSKGMEISVFDPDIKDFNPFLQDKVKIIDQLRSAVSENRVIPYFQPIYDMQTGKITKYEALMRIGDGEGGVITPDKFLNISKQSRIYPLLTAKMVEITMAYFENREEEFSINMSFEDLMNPETVRFVINESIRTNTSSRLIIEIVESEEIKNYEEVERVLLAFKKVGIRIAIDDFGVGYSVYDWLLKINADFIKIDGSIIKNIQVNDQAEKLVSSIVKFANESGIKVVAEFVDSGELVDLLKKNKVDYAQGYYFGKPEKDVL